jgi:GNAT superfamily N-acetyltransferase
MLTLAQSTLEHVDRYWTTFFACPRSALHSHQTHVLPHAGIGDYHGVFMLVRDDSVLASVPPALLEGMRPRLEHVTAAEALDTTRLLAILGPQVERCIGPAFVGYADVQTFRPLRTNAARLLDEHDAPALERLRAACDPVAWEHGGSKLGTHPLAGIVVHRELAALAGYEVWDAQIAHSAVVTHPTHRGKGRGRAVVSQITAEALRRGLVPQYRTLGSNTPAMAIAQALGFVPYAHSMAVRLKR